MHMDPGTLVPLSTIGGVNYGGEGLGMALCPTLALLVTSSLHDALHVFALPTSLASSTSLNTRFELLYLLGGAFSSAPMKFKFRTVPSSGWMAFTGPGAYRLLVVTDAGHKAVHVIDVVSRAHVGYVSAPGTIDNPRGVASHGSLVAVSTCGFRGQVRVYEGSGASWAPVRVLADNSAGTLDAGDRLKMLCGLRFTADGLGLVVADNNGSVNMFRMKDGAFARHGAPTVMPIGAGGSFDVEECEGGWLVAGAGSIEFVSDGGATKTAISQHDGQFCTPTAVAIIPGLGFAIREYGYNGRLQLFATPDVMAMAVMSPCRVAWMTGVNRGVLHRVKRFACTAPVPKRKCQGRPE